MRARIVSLTLVFLLASFVAESVAADGGSATLAYQNRVQSIVTQRVSAALIPRFQQLQRAGSGAVGVRFRVLATGQVESVAMTRRHPAGFANSTCTRAIEYEVPAHSRQSYS